MNSPRPELPNDLDGCHAVIEQLRAELQVAAQQIEEMKAIGMQDAERLAARRTWTSIVRLAKKHYHVD